MFGSRGAKHMNTFNFMQATIPRKVKDPHSETLEPGGLSPRIAVTTQPHGGEEPFIQNPIVIL
jgi:hypothetical protein